MSQAQDFAKAFIQNLAGDAALNPNLQEVLGNILANQVMVGEDGVVQFKPAFNILAQVFTYISTTPEERPETGVIGYGDTNIQQAKNDAGTDLGLVIDDGTTPTPGDSFSLTADAASVDEGATATFTVQAAEGQEPLTEGTEVAYTLSGVDAEDVDGELTGTATVSADGTATISVALTEDQATEGAETLTVELEDGATASTTVNDTSVATAFTLSAAQTQINEGASNTFTVTASQPVAEDTTVTFELKVEDETASLEDFNAGAFNPVTVTIPAGETEATFDVESISADGTEASETYRVEATVNGETLSQQVTLLDGAEGAGQNFILTDGLDVMPGMEGSNGNTVTSGNDTITGIVALNSSGDEAAATTFNSFDQLNAGDGTDTLKLAISGGNTGSDYDANLSNLENVEIVELSSTAISSGVNVDTSSVDGITNLNVTKAASAIDATAAATTDVDVSMKSAGETVKVDGGNNVNVALTDISSSGDTVTIGSGEAPKGDVTVEMTGEAYDAGSTVTLSEIEVTGGQTIDITQSATSDSSAAADDTSSGTVTQGNITAKANADTKTISIKQDATVDAKDAEYTSGGVTESTTVQFHALSSGNTLNLDLDGTGGSGITLTAQDDMTAEEVASAFANLLASSPRLDGSGDLSTDGDTQGSIAYTKGIFSGDTAGGTGTGDANWYSSAANGDTVVFTSTTANDDVTDLIFSGNSGSGSTTPTAPVQTKTQGKAHNADAQNGVMGVNAGDVTITGAAALETVTVDGYSTGDLSGANNNALETINLSNGGDFTIQSAAATLALNLENVDGDLNMSGAGVTTLNLKSTGDNVINDSGSGDLSSVTELNVSGDGLLDGSGTSSSGVDLSAATAITVSETAGLDLTNANLTGLESVDTTATTGTVTIAIDGNQATYAGGAGVDNVTVGNASGTRIDKAIDLGAGNDTLTLIFDGSSSADLPTTELKGGDGTDTLSMATADAAGLGTDFAAQVTGFERLELNDQVDLSSGDVDVDTEALGFTDYVITNGQSGGRSGSGDSLDLNNLADNATLVLADAGTGSGSIEAHIKDANTNAANTLNVIAEASGTGLDVGTLTAADIETINLTSEGGSTDTAILDLAADKAANLNVTGDANLELDVSASTKLTSLDASAMNGDLTVDLMDHNGEAVTIQGGSGDDMLAASVGANASADVLHGNDGDDVLYAGTNGATLNGGAGDDLFVLAAGGSSGEVGNKEANTYTTIEDFGVGNDVLQLIGGDGSGTAPVSSFEKLTASLNEATATFKDFADAATEQAGVAESVWFSFGGDSYVVVDNGDDSGSGSGDSSSFVDGEDMVIKLTNVSLDDASFNSDYGTISLG